MSVSLRRTFKYLMSNYGEDVILYRHCPCVESGLYATRNCDECHKTGFSKVAERHKARRMAVMPADQAANYQMEGVVQQDDSWAWFAHYVNPAPGDMVVFADPSATHGKIIYRIVSSFPLRGVKGRIEYWRVGLRREAVK